MNLRSVNNQAPTVSPIQDQPSRGLATCDVTDPDRNLPPTPELRPAQILVVSSELETHRTLTAILSREGWGTICASRVSESQEVLARQNIGLVFCDRRLPDGTYHDVLAIMRSLNQHVRLVVVSRLADWDEYLEARHQGAFELIVSPCRPGDVAWTLMQAKREDEERAVSGAPGKARSAAAGQGAV